LRVRLSWSSCSHEHVYVGCPSSATRFLSVARVGRELPHSRRCRPQGSCPSRRFRLARGSLRGLLDPAVRRGPRRFAAFFHAARVPGASLQSFPFPRSRTRSRGPFLPCEFAFDCRRRSARGSFTIAFPDSRASSLPSNPPESGPGTHEPGRRFLAIASPVASTRKRAARTVLIPLTLGSPVSGRHARFEALLPPGVRSATIPLTWPGWNRPSVLSWDSHPPEFSPPRFGIRSVAQPHAGDARSLCRVRLRAPSHRGCIAATRTPTPGLASPGSVDTRSRSNPRITVRRRPSSLNASRAFRAPATSPVRALSSVEDGASCPCPLSAALRASLPFTTSSPERAPIAGPRRRSDRTVHQHPGLATRGGGHAPHGA